MPSIWQWKIYAWIKMKKVQPMLDTWITAYKVSFTSLFKLLWINKMLDIKTSTSLKRTNKLIDIASILVLDSLANKRKQIHLKIKRFVAKIVIVVWATLFYYSLIQKLSNCDKLPLYTENVFNMTKYNHRTAQWLLLNVRRSENNIYFILIWDISFTNFLYTISYLNYT